MIAPLFTSATGRANVGLMMCLLLMVGAELLAVYVDPLCGVAAYMLLLLFMMVEGALLRAYPVHGFLLALGLVPLIRVVSLSIPLSEVRVVYGYLVMAIPVLVGALSVAVALRMELVEFGRIGRAAGTQVMVVVIGVPIAVLDYMILKPDALIGALTWRDLLLPALVLLVAGGFVEELVFRGVLQRKAQTIGPWGWVYVAVVSSLLQVGQGSALHWVLALGTALLYGWSVRRSESILAVSLSHGIIAVCVYLVFPFVL